MATETYPVRIRPESGIRLNTPDIYEGEHIWSYLSRLANANGLADATAFMKEIGAYISPFRKSQFLYGFSCEVPYPEIDRILDIGTPNDWRLDATTYGLKSLFLSRYRQLSHLYSYSVLWKQKTSFWARHISDINTMQACPECLEEDIGEGTFHYHVEHQINSIEYCPKHGLMLVPVEKREVETSKPTFSLMTGRSFYPMHLGLEELRELYAECREKDFIGTAITHASRKEERIGMFWRAFMEEQPDGTMEDLQEAITSRLRERYRYKETWKLKMAILDDKDLDEYRPIGLNARSMQLTTDSPITYVNPNEAMGLIAGLFESPEDLFENLHVRSYREEFEKAIHGRFELIGPYRESLITIRCLECGKTFPTTPLAIISELGCPECNKKLSNQEIMFRMFEKASAGRWYLDSEFKSLNDMISVISRETEEEISTSAERFLFYDDKLLPETQISPAKRKAYRDHKRMVEDTAILEDAGVPVDANSFKTLEHIKPVVQDYMLTHPVIFLPNLKKYGDERIIRNYCNRLATKGLLHNVDRGIYTTSPMDVDDVIWAKYWITENNQKGAPVCESLLKLARDERYPDSRHREERPAFVLYDEGVSTRHHDVRTVADREIDIYYVHTPITVENWPAISLLASMKQSEKMFDPFAPDYFTLRLWTLLMNITGTKVIRNSEGFPEWVVKQVYSLILTKDDIKGTKWEKEFQKMEKSRKEGV